MKKTAFITGITGQDGFYLTELLLQKNYRVIGFSNNVDSSELNPQVEYIQGDLADADSLFAAIQKSQPDEIYNLASQSYPSESWKRALETMQINGLSAHHLFEIVRTIKPNCRIYQASSSEMYGAIHESPQTEKTPFNPINPYAAAKLYAHHIAGIYRKTYNLFISCGILFNHESSKRPPHFITQKVTYAAACIKLGLLNSPLLNEQREPIVKNGILQIGNLDACRDWGFAGDYVRAMWLMLQQPKADDFVIGTGIGHRVRDLCEIAFAYVNLDWQKHVKVDPRFQRPAETGDTIADASKAKNTLGWEPEIPFAELIQQMVETHLVALSQDIVKC